MSTAKEDKGTRTQIDDFIIAKVEDRFLRFGTLDTVPEGAEALTKAKVEELPKDKIGELYGSIAGVSAKNFKDKRVAVESLLYQVAKMPIFDPSAPKVEAKPTEKGTASSAPRVPRKSNETFQLLNPPEMDKIVKGLAPQARELVLIMTDLASEKKSATFSGADLEAKLQTEDAKNRLRTKQDTMRILQYYKGKLISSGLIRTS